MKLVTMSRRELEAARETLTAGPVCAAICIAQMEGRLHRLYRFGSLWRVHHARFSDCYGDGTWCFPEHKEAKVGTPMTRGQALDIVTFYDELPAEVETLYIACYGGVSRSHGLARGLAKRYGLHYEARNGKPNPFVEKLILEVKS